MLPKNEYHEKMNKYYIKKGMHYDLDKHLIKEPKSTLIAYIRWLLKYLIYSKIDIFDVTWKEGLIRSIFYYLQYEYSLINGESSINEDLKNLTSKYNLCNINNNDINNIDHRLLHFATLRGSSDNLSVCRLEM